MINILDRRRVLMAVWFAVLPHVIFMPPRLMLPTLALLFSSSYFWGHLGKRVPSWLIGVMGPLAAWIIFQSYKSWTGLEPGLALLVWVLALKLLETKAQRDIVVLTWLVAALILGELLVTQNLFTTAYGFLGLAMVIWLLGLGNSPVDTSPRLIELRHIVPSFRLLKLSAPITLILFVVFPRIPLNPLARMQFLPEAKVGFNDEIRPGDIAELARTDRTAFRVRFMSNQAPAIEKMYWRGAVLSVTDGFSWIKSSRSRTLVVLQPKIEASADNIEHEILLEPSGNRWLFALDRPLSLTSDSMREAQLPRYGQTFVASQSINKRQAYRVLSSLEFAGLSTNADDLERETRMRAKFSPEIIALASELGKATTEEMTIIGNILDYFHREGFLYTLEPGKMDSLDQFLFGARKGFCEHFASATAILLRLNGIPARVVVGFHGGVYNRYSGFWTVGYRDAHAWVEAWVKGKGWIRIDPTKSIAPGRIELGSQDFAAGRSVASVNNNDSSGDDSKRDLRWLLREAYFIVDGINSRWNIALVSYDFEYQMEFLQRFAFSVDEKTLAFVILLLAGAVIAAYFLYLQRTLHRLDDPILTQYNRIIRRLRRFELEPNLGEGPLDFAERCAKKLPISASKIKAVLTYYTQLRYGRMTVSPDEIRELGRRIRDLP